MIILSAFNLKQRNQFIFNSYLVFQLQDWKGVTMRNMVHHSSCWYSGTGFRNLEGINTTDTIKKKNNSLLCFLQVNAVSDNTTFLLWVIWWVKGSYHSIACEIKSTLKAANFNESINWLNWRTQTILLHHTFCTSLQVCMHYIFSVPRVVWLCFLRYHICR